jgi:hypothetical protein
VAFTFGLRLIAKMPCGTITSSAMPCFDLIPGIAGKRPPSMALTATLISPGGTPADGVAAAQLIPAQRGFKRQVLPGRKR